MRVDWLRRMIRPSRWRAVVVESLPSVPRSATPGRDIDVWPRSGAPGTVVQVMGRNFPPRVDGRVVFSGRMVASVSTGDDGRFLATFTIPATALTGRRYVTAVIGKETARALFTVLASPPPAPPPEPSPEPVTNPLAGVRLYVDPNSPARRNADQWRTTRPGDAVALDKIAQQPVGSWFGEWSGDILAAVNARVTAAAGAVPVLVPYNIPQRDCGSYSAGGLGSPEAYRAWIREFAAGIGGRPAVVILEPDAVPGYDCLNTTDRGTRLGLLSDAVQVLTAHPGVVVYIDAGHSRWHSAVETASRLTKAGIDRAHGFSLNVSNYRGTEEVIAFGDAVSALVGGKHYVIDTSRNGLGPNGSEWCNPSGRALGPRPTTNTGHPLVDAFLWVKVPGESDGTCNGGPRAGQWWPDYALGLASRAAW